MTSLSFPAITDVALSRQSARAAQVKLLSRNPHVGTCAFFSRVIRHIPPYFIIFYIIMENIKLTDLT